ncbi:MAG: tRNA (N6-isopentenyl adenosine(37)-C2)-methylthiotransferase MiaB [Rhizobacter sp.]|nr:tRNA (N6-isopentenyl adenosine(37)-C2)-methylthiotransferase MiaB [Ferruginibacter sp.]
METLLLDKIHDEARQGEAFMAAPVETISVRKHFYIESYGCAMNFADSEVVASILQEHGYAATTQTELADLILVNTCSIREKAEQTVRQRLTVFRQYKKLNPGVVVGVLGCMAERLKSKFLEEEKLVDIVVGPDAYRSLPGLIEEASGGQKGVNVLLSRDETYADIAPIRLNSNGVTAFVSIMRGCNNMCSFCVVPFTRGRERSRDAYSIVKECEALFNDGYREVTLLGQNVDSYYFAPPPPKGRIVDVSNKENNGSISPLSSSPFPRPLAEIEGAGAVTFALLMEMVAQISPLLRVRFSTSHPKDITDDVLFVMQQYENICNYIHLPVQSGSSRVLQMMNRTYSREWYMAKVNRIRELLPDCGLSTDMITGFCTETEEEHKESLSLMEYCKYDLAYMYFYSERPGTLAARRFKDDVPLETKKRRLQEMVSLHRLQTLKSMQKDVGKTFKVLVEGVSKKNEEELYGRTDHNKVVIFPKGNLKKADYIKVLIDRCTSGTLFGTPLTP